MRRGRSRVLVAGSALALIALLPVHALAVPDDELHGVGDVRGEAKAALEGHGAELRATDGSTPRGTEIHTPRAIGHDCRAELLDDAVERERLLAVDSAIPRGAIIYFWICPTSTEVRWYLPGSTDPSEHDAVGGLIEEAIGRVEPPAPQVVTAPPLGTPIMTGFPMYLAVDEDAYTSATGQVTAGQFTVTATLEPIETSFDPGDQHDPRTCPGPGSRWNPGDRPGPDDCTHTYTHTPEHLHGHDVGGSYPLTTRVLYHATYTVEGPILAGTYDLGTLEGPATTLDIPVTERRAVRTTS